MKELKAYRVVIPAKAGIHMDFVVMGFRVKPGMTSSFWLNGF